MPLSTARRAGLVEQVIDQLRHAVTVGEWPVGQRIPNEAVLVESLGVGRNTVREAVRALAHAGILEVRQGDGTYVRTNVDPVEVMRRVGRSDLREHFALRNMLEAEAARLAAAHRSKADVGLLRRLLNARGEREQHVSSAAFAEADTAFHCAIAGMCGNGALAELYRYFANSVRLNTLTMLEDKELPEPGLAAHKVIVDAIERQDGEAAAAAVRNLVAPLIAALEKSS